MITCRAARGMFVPGFDLTIDDNGAAVLDDDLRFELPEAAVEQLRPQVPDVPRPAG
jgi:hypothetical protein